MTDAFICDAVRTPFGRFAGALSPVRTDDLAAHPIKALKERNPSVDWEAVDDIVCFPGNSMIAAGKIESIPAQLSRVPVCDDGDIFKTPTAHHRRPLLSAILTRHCGKRKF